MQRYKNFLLYQKAFIIKFDYFNYELSSMNYVQILLDYRLPLILMVIIYEIFGFA